MKTRLFLASFSSLVLIAACGGGGTNNDTPGDDMPGIDAGIDAPVPTMLTISGTATSRGVGGSAPEPGVLIAAFTNANENTPVAMATTDAAGAFSLVITTMNGAPLDGFLKATKTGFITSYLYPPAPVGGDLMMVPMNMIATNLFDTFSTLAGGSQMPQNGLIGMIVVSGQAPTSPPVAGATITSTPASNPYRYNGANGLPSPSTTSTQADGLAYAFNAPVGPITVQATKSGLTFKPTMLKSRAMSLTQTLIVTP